MILFSNPLKLKRTVLVLAMFALSTFPNIGKSQFNLEAGGGLGFVHWGGMNWFRPQYTIFAPDLIAKGKIGFYFKLEQTNGPTSLELPKHGKKFVDNWGITYKINNQFGAYYGRALINLQTAHPEQFPFTGRQDLGMSYYPKKIPVSVKVGYTFWLGPHFDLTYRILKKEGVDTDKDGIRNRFDKCKKTDPRYVGWVNDEGCPKDSDNDQIPDIDDSCRNEKGLAVLRGCPDADGDMVADKYDNCPGEPGLREFKGCPPPPPAPIEVKKSDSLAIPEPTVLTKDEKLALLLKESSPKFVFDNYVLLPEFKKKLDDVVAYLNENPTSNILLVGHTDQVGSAEYNMTLSVKRAMEVKKYLISKGINTKRISTIGKGATSPLFLDNSETAKMANRRVELIIK